MIVENASICGNKDLLNLGIDLKFVVVDRDGERFVRINEGRKVHAQLIPNDTTLIGGGFVNADKGFLVEWGSNSCCNVKGYDRPRNRDEAEKVAIEVRDALTNWAAQFK